MSLYQHDIRQAINQKSQEILEVKNQIENIPATENMFQQRTVNLRLRGLKVQLKTLNKELKVLEEQVF